MVLGFVALALWFGYKMSRMAAEGRQELIDTVEVRAVVLELIPERGRPLTKRMRLSDGTVRYVPDSAVPRVHLGDSVLKRRGEDFYTFVAAGTGRRLKAQVGR